MGLHITHLVHVLHIEGNNTFKAWLTDGSDLTVLQMLSKEHAEGGGCRGSRLVLIG